MSAELLTLRPEGLYCAEADVFIDPWRPVPRAIFTHGHADHARAIAPEAIAAERGLGILRARLGEGIRLQGLAWGERLRLGSAIVSLHPASHVLGAAQVRVESARGEVWVVSGDYRVAADASCDAFEPVACHTFISECTFGLPIYRWRPQAEVLNEILAWWQQGAAEGRASLIYAYALGKAQRILCALADLGRDAPPMQVHRALLPLLEAYEAQGIRFAPYTPADLTAAPTPGVLFLAPPALQGSAWATRHRRLLQQATASGWMALRGVRRRQPGVRGFVLSDHADWPGLTQAIEATGAQRVLLTHGATDTLARYLREERGIDAQGLRMAGPIRDAGVEE